MKQPVNKGKTSFQNKASKGNLPPAFWHRLERFNALGIRTAGFLHQLKTPLQVIQSQAEFLLEDNALPELNSRKPIYPGESYEYTFLSPGTFGYHNELNPSASGRIIVK